MKGDTGAAPKMSRKERARLRDANRLQAAAPTPTTAEPRDNLLSEAEQHKLYPTLPAAEAAQAALSRDSPAGFISVQHLLDIPRFHPHVLPIGQYLEASEPRAQLQPTLACSSNDVLEASPLVVDLRSELVAAQSQLTLALERNEELKSSLSELQVAHANDSLCNRKLQVELSVAQRRLGRYTESASSTAQKVVDGARAHGAVLDEQLASQRSIFTEELDFARSEVCTRNRRIADLSETIVLQQHVEQALMSAYEEQAASALP